LIEWVAAHNPRTIVVVMGGSAVVMERWRAQVPAILLLWYPGMEGGHALADVLLGRACPSGRLPFAVATDAAHWPTFDPDATTATYDLWHGQWKLARDGHAPAYPFGFGLSYTEFTLADVTVVGPPTNPVVRATLRNRGACAGADVVQVYASVPASRHERPLERLVGFRRVELAPGAAHTIEIPVAMDMLAIRQHGGWVMERGRYELAVGRHAGDPQAHRVSFQLD
jgi:beta-glucosidase